MRFVIIQSGIVANITEVDAETTATRQVWVDEVIDPETQEVTPGYYAEEQYSPGAEFAAQQGWIAANDAQIGWLWDGEAFTAPVVPGPTAQEIIDALEAAVQRHLDTTAQERGYDHMLSLATYATSTNVRFAAEGQAGVQWRDDVWQACLDIMADVQAQLRSVPTEAELIAELPVLVWPV